MNFSFLRVSLLLLALIFYFISCDLKAQQANDKHQASAPAAKEDKNKTAKGDLLKQAIEKLASDNKQEVEKAAKELLADRARALTLLIDAVSHSNELVRMRSLEMLATFSQHQAQIVPVLETRLEKEDKAQVLRKIIATLSLLQAKNSAKKISALLQYPDEKVKADAIWILTVFHYKPLPKQLLEMLKSEKSPIVKAAALRSLAVYKDAPSIINALEAIPDQSYPELKPEVLMAIADCAAALATPYGMEALADIASGAPAPEVRSYALNRLLPFIDANNVGLLIEILWDENKGNRSLAFKKLAAVTIQTFGYDPKSKLLDRAAAIEKAEKWWQIQQALKAFSKTDGKKRQQLRQKIIEQGPMAAPYLIEYYPRISLPQIKVALIEILAHWNTPEVVAFIAAKTKQNDVVKAAALQGLQKLQKQAPSPQILEIIKKAFTDASVDEKRDLAGYLAARGDAAALIYLKKLFKQVPQQALELIDKHEINHPDASKFLGELLQGKQPQLAQKSFELLLKLKSWHSLTVNYPVLTPKQRSRLIEVLQAQKDILSLLLPHLETEKDQAIKTRLATALAKVPQAQARLQKMLTGDITPALQQEIIKALQANKALSAAQIIAVFPKIKNEQVQQLLLNSLPMSKGQNIEKLLFEIAGGNYPEKLRQQAVSKAAKINAHATVDWVLDQVMAQKSQSLQLAWLAALTGKIRQSDFAKIEKLAALAGQPPLKSAVLHLVKGLPYATVAPLLQHLIEKDPGVAVKQTALTLLSGYRKQLPVDYLEKIYEKSQGTWRQALYTAIYNLAPDKGVKLLQTEINRDPPDLDALSLLASRNADLARPLLPQIFPKLKKFAKKRYALRIGQQVCSYKELDFLLGIIAGANQELRTIAARILDRVTGVTSGFDAKKKDASAAIALWKKAKEEHDAIEKIIATLRQSTDPAAIASLRRQLLAYKARAVTALIQAIKDQQELKGMLVLLETLAQTRDAKAIKLLEKMLDAPDVEVRGMVYRQLAAIGHKSFLEKLPYLYLFETAKLGRVILLSLMSEPQFALYRDELPAYASATDPQILQLVLTILSKHQVPGAQSLVGKILAQAPTAEIIQQAVPLLRQDMRHASVLVAILQSGKQPQLEKTLLSLLAAYPDIPAAECKDKATLLTWWQQNHKQVTRWIELASTIKQFITATRADLAVKQEQLERLENSERDWVGARLLLRLKDDKTLTSEQKQRILNLLAIYRAAKALPYFDNFLTDENAQVREAASRGIYSLGYKIAATVAKKAYTHKDPVVRFFAIKTIGEGGSDKISKLLIDALGDDDVRVREEALFWANRAGIDDKKLAIKLIKDKGPWVRALAIELAARLKIKAVMAELVHYLDDPFPWVRKAAYQALRTLSGQNIAYNPDQDHEQRQEGLKKWQQWWRLYHAGQETVDLVEKLIEPDINAEKVRERIIAHYQGGTPATQKAMLDKIIGYLQDPRGSIRWQSVQLLAALKDYQFASALGERLTDPDLRVRASAFQAVSQLSAAKLELSLPEYKDWPAKVQQLDQWSQKQQQRLSEQSQQQRQQLDQQLAQAKEGQLAPIFAAVPPDTDELLASYLSNSKIAVAIAAAKELCRRKAWDSVAPMLVLLQHEPARKELRPIIEKMIGTALPLADASQLRQKYYQRQVASWWQQVRQQTQQKAIADLEKLLNQFSEKTEKLETIAKKIAALGADIRPHLEEYLADKRPTVKNGIVLALAYLNDQRSIAAMLPYLQDTPFPVRTSILAGIQMLAGQVIYNEKPESEQQWQQCYEKVSKWWQEQQQKRPQQLKAFVAENQAALLDPKHSQKTIKRLVGKGPEIYPQILPLLAHDNPEMRLAALAILKEVKLRAAVEAIIPLLADSDKKVAKAAQETIAALAGEKLPQPRPEQALWQEAITAVQKWWQQNQKQLAGFDRQQLRSLLQDIGQDKIAAREATAKLQAVKIEIDAALQSYAHDRNDNIRLGVVKAMALARSLAQLPVLVSCLSDPDIRVRQSTLGAIASKTGEKPPLAIDAGKEEKWRQQVEKWLPQWLKQQQQHRLDQQLSKLTRLAKPVSDISRIWTKKQLQTAEKIYDYLNDPFAKVRSQAFGILQRLAKGMDRDIVFHAEGESGERKEDLADIKTWLDGIEKTLEEQEKNLQQRLAAINGKDANLLTVAGCEKLQTFIEEMLNLDRSHPAIQKKYLEVLKSKHCPVFDYNVYASDKAREDIIYKIIEKVIYERKQVLRQAEKDAESWRQKHAEALTLKRIDNQSDLAKARTLVKVLPHADYELRRQALGILENLADSRFDYRADLPESVAQKQALVAWQNWLKAKQKELEQQRKRYLAEVAKAAGEFAKLKAISGQQQCQQAKLLVEALADNEQSVRQQAVTALQKVSGKNFGYVPARMADDQEEALGKWQNWLQQRQKHLEKRHEVEQAAAQVKIAAKVQTAAQVKKIAILVTALTSLDLETRATAFQVLSDYARRHHAAEVREDFGYDPKAPRKIIEKTAADWQKWFADKIAPVATQEEQRLANIERLSEKIVLDNTAALQDGEDAAKLVEALSDASVSIRQKALAALRKLAEGKDYGFDPKAGPTQQQSALGLWSWWIKLQKRKIAKNIEQRLGKLARLTKSAPAHPQFSTIQTLLTALGDREVKVRRYAYDWLKQKSGNDFGYNPSATVEKRQQAQQKFSEWFTAERDLALAKDLQKQLGGSVTAKERLAKLNQLLGYLKHRAARVRQQAATAFIELAKGQLSFKASEAVAQPQAVQQQVENWLQGQAKRVELEQSTGKLTTLKNRQDTETAQKLVRALESPYLAVREYAIQRLNQIAGKKFGYQADASEDERFKALTDIENWLQQQKDKL